VTVANTSLRNTLGEMALAMRKKTGRFGCAPLQRRENASWPWIGGAANGPAALIMSRHSCCVYREVGYALACPADGKRTPPNIGVYFQ
jgi:hypothetical protein